MSAGNAFAATEDGVSSRLGHGQNGDRDQRRPLKRQRTSDTFVPPTWLPTAQSETSLEVDIMILDFLAFQATTACLNSRKPEDHQAPRTSVQLVDSFTVIFKARHTQYQPDAELRLRLLLLKMTTLFTQRFTLNPTTPDRQNLTQLRSVNRQRAEAWVRDSDAPALPQQLHTNAVFTDLEMSIHRLERNRAHVLHQLGLPSEDEDYEDAFYGTTESLALLDLLPMFLELSAASSSIHNNTLNPRWMHLACEFMLQACLEQYLVCGVTSLDVLDQAFAWGYLHEPGPDASNVKARHGVEVNDMFENDEYATEVEGWRELKAEYARQLVDVEGHKLDEESDFASHLENVAAKHQIGAFEASVLKFLEALSASIAQPMLTQLQSGQLDGMSKEETKDFLVQCGVFRSVS